MIEWHEALDPDSVSSWWAHVNDDLMSHYSLTITVDGNRFRWSVFKSVSVAPADPKNNWESYTKYIALGNAVTLDDAKSEAEQAFYGGKQ
jgi:hypothetical protein